MSDEPERLPTLATHLDAGCDLASLPGIERLAYEAVRGVRRVPLDKRSAEAALLREDASSPGIGREEATRLRWTAEIYEDNALRLRLLRALPTQLVDEIEEAEAAAAGPVRWTVGTPGRDWTCAQCGIDREAGDAEIAVGVIGIPWTTEQTKQNDALLPGPTTDTHVCAHCVEHVLAIARDEIRAPDSLSGILTA